MFKNKYVKIVLYVVFFIAVWNLGDYIYSLIDSEHVFQFKILGSLLIPLVLGLVVGFYYYVRKKD